LKVPYTIVGLVSDAKYTSVREDPIPMAYFPYEQVGGVTDMHVEVRTLGDVGSILRKLRETIANFAPDLAPLQPMMQKAQFEETIMEERLLARLATFFGILAAVLVATGLYGAQSYAVSRRTSEMGIRMALGAPRSGILAMILWESLGICLAGVVLGLPLLIASGKVLKSMLYGVAPRDPIVIICAAAGIVLVSLLAAFIPARRAASVDPMVALRWE
jgi:ABC-type antimicrobial peptide transport system permease subunit